MNLVALHLSLSKLAVGYMHKLSAKGPGHKVVNMRRIVTFGLKVWMLMATLPNMSTNFLKDSPLLLPNVDQSNGNQVVRSGGG